MSQPAPGGLPMGGREQAIATDCVAILAARCTLQGVGIGVPTSAVAGTFQTVLTYPDGTVYAVMIDVTQLGESLGGGTPDQP